MYLVFLAWKLFDVQQRLQTELSRQQLLLEQDTSDALDKLHQEEITAQAAYKDAQDSLTNMVSELIFQQMWLHVQSNRT